jgi:molecular chaperone GrpE
MTDDVEESGTKEAPAEGEPDFVIDLDALTEEDVRELLEKAAQADAYLEKLKFKQAEFQNFKKRLGREKEEWRRFGLRDFVVDLLPALDTFERAVEAECKTEEERCFLEGFGMILTMFRDAFAKFGVRPIEAMGKPFDPCFHEAAGFVDAPGVEPNDVAVELSRGYTLHDRVIRPSKVMVARPPESAGGEEKEEEDEPSCEEEDA